MALQDALTSILVYLARKRVDMPLNMKVSGLSDSGVTEIILHLISLWSRSPYCAVAKGLLSFKP